MERDKRYSARMKMLISSFFLLFCHTTQQTSERTSYTTKTGARGCYEDLKEENIIKSVTSQSIFFFVPLTLCFVCILQLYSTCAVYCICVYAMQYIFRQKML